MARLYTKKVWVNEQTKLSAKNLNHIEDGVETLAEEIDVIEENIHGIGEEKQAKLVSGVNIQTINGHDILGEGNYQIEGHTHSNLEILEQIDTPFTTALKQEFTDKSTVNVSFAGEATDTVQYITINGIEYKLAGGSNIPEYYERDNISLDRVLDPGIYKVIDAIKNPENTSRNGILSVTKLANGIVEQKWSSTTNSAIRLLDPNEVGLLFYVNDEIVDQGEVRLVAGGTYKLHGDLIGNVVIDGPADNRTKIILDGVNIQSDEAESIINYLPEGSKLVIEVSNNTENYLVVNVEGPTQDEGELAVINSENNLMLTGVGYLTIINKKGHGIKASELIIDGDIHAYLDTNHDAIHGGKLLKITGGYFEVENANDAFSASEGGSNTGKLLIYGGTYIINNCKEAAFEGKSSLGIKRILGADITLGEGVNKLFNASNASSDAYKIKVYQGLNTITNLSGQEYTTVNLADDFTNPPTIIFGGEVHIEPIDGVFTLTAGGDYKLSGNFSNYRIVSNPSGEDKINLILDNVYYNNDTETEPFIEHLSELKRIKFDTTKNEAYMGKLCYIRKAHGNIITSGKNIQFDGKSDVIIDGCGTANCGLYTPAGYVLLANDALRKIMGCETGIHADNVRLGKDPDDILDGKYSTSDAEIYLQDNNTDIILTNQGSYENYHGLVIAPQYHTGISIIGTVDGEINTIEAQEGLIGDANYSNSAILYLGSATGGELININTYEEPIGTISEVPVIEPPVSRWTVYKGDGYTKEETDNNFVSKVEYNTLKTELDNRAPRKIDIINYVEDATKTDHRPVKDHAYCPVEIDGETVYVADSIEIFRYACPERIDIDDTPETHGDYIKDGRPMYARDGDFGYPEIDKTGQFNFRPIWNTPGYVLLPDSISPADGYNNFKTQWNIGIPGMYRVTKANKDLTLDLHAVLESEIPAHIITYKIMAPVSYSIEDLPQVRVFRGADHCEKFMKYGPGTANPKPHPELAEGLISGNLLILGEPEVEEIDGVSYNVWTILDKAYDDSTGLPSADTGDKTNAKVYFNVSGTPAEGYAYTVDAKKVGTNFNKLNNPTAEKNYYTLTKVAGNIEVDIKVVIDVADVTLTFVNNTSYSVEDTVTKAVITEPLIINGLQDYQFKVNHQLGDGGAHDAIITSVSVDGIEGTVLKTTDLEGADATVVWKASNKKDECRIKKAYIPTAKGTEHNIVITLGTATVIEPEQGSEELEEVPLINPNDGSILVGDLNPVPTEDDNILYPVVEDTAEYHESHNGYWFGNYDNRIPSFQIIDELNYWYKVKSNGGLSYTSGGQTTNEFYIWKERMSNLRYIQPGSIPLD